MKILQVCSKIPYPSKDGGSIAMNILTEGLIETGNQVTVLAMSTRKSFVKTGETVCQLSGKNKIPDSFHRHIH